jgi:hypothetical protein
MVLPKTKSQIKIQRWDLPKNKSAYINIELVLPKTRAQIKKARILPKKTANQHIIGLCLKQNRKSRKHEFYLKRLQINI